MAWEALGDVSDRVLARLVRAVANENRKAARIVLVEDARRSAGAREALSPAGTGRAADMANAAKGK